MGNRGFFPNKEKYCIRRKCALGKRLLVTVNDVMAKDDDMPFVCREASIKDAIIEMTSKAIVVGVAIVDESHKLCGIFTDGDLRRLIVNVEDVSAMEKKINEVMTSI